MNGLVYVAIIAKKHGKNLLAAWCQSWHIICHEVEWDHLFLKYYHARARCLS